MRVKQLISAGRSGVERAALDAAIGLGIAHGGWVPKGRKVDDGPLSKEYQLSEISSESELEAVEENVRSSAGTLILLLGKMTSAVDHARKSALTHKRQLLGLDLQQTEASRAAELVHSWIDLQHVDILYVTGHLQSQAHEIYRRAFTVVRGALLLDLIRTDGSAPLGSAAGSHSPAYGMDPPTSVHQAVDRLMSLMPLKDRVTLAHLNRDQLKPLQDSLGIFIRNSFGLLGGNDALVESCRSEKNQGEMMAETAVKVIIEALWKRVRESHRLRLIK